MPPSEQPGGPTARSGFVLEYEDRSLRFRYVRGFRDALAATSDPRRDVPRQLVVLGPSREALAWLAAWSEDIQRSRRTVTIRRLDDDASLVVYVSLASFGVGVETSLLIESLGPTPLDGAPDARSGVHPKEAIDPLLARRER